MKRFTALLLAIILILSLAACGENNGGKDDPEPAPKVSDDVNVLGMSLAVPTGYKSVERSYDKLTDGSIVEKNLKYAFADGSVLNFAASAAPDYDISEMILEQFGEDMVDEREVSGHKFYVLTYESEIYGLCQTEELIYGLRYTFPDGDSPAEGGEVRTSPVFDEALSSLRFSDDMSAVENPEGLGAVSYTLNDDLNLVMIFDVLRESPDGAQESKSYAFSFGESKDNVTVKFLVRRDSGAKLEDVLAEISLNDGGTLSEKKIGGLTYTTRADDTGTYQYYIQRGEDVYVFMNLLAGSGWYASRSEESYKAFDKFMESVTFSE